MDFMAPASVAQLEKYFHGIGQILGSDERRASFATYAMGIFSDAERKSAEPLAARANIDPKRVDAEHQRLLHFLGNAVWNDHAVRQHAAKFALNNMLAREPLEAWIFDDTGFLKQGKHSVGVKRQYTGSAGKIANCQIGVSLVMATSTEHLPIDFELYLPSDWTEDAARRKEAKIPDDIAFKTKPELALQMLKRAVDAGIPKAPVLADAAYGTSHEFREQLRALDFNFAVAVNSTTKVQLLGLNGKPGQRESLVKLAQRLEKKKAFNRVTWRQGSRRALTARFVRRQVRVSETETVTLLIEWRDDEPTPSNYFFISVPDIKATKSLVRLVMQRWRIERTYEDLKGELGLDHYEGRGFPGWHHHVSVVLCCYAFIIAERTRLFFSSTRGARQASANSSAPRAPLPS